MSTPTPTPGIAGRYFVLERRERFAKLTARVFIWHENRTVTLVNDEILSPRRIARALEVSGAAALDVADKIYAAMKAWSLKGFPTSEAKGDSTVRIVAGPMPCAGQSLFVRLQDGGQL